MTAAETVEKYRREKTTRLFGHVIGWLFVAGCALGAWAILCPAVVPAPEVAEEGSDGSGAILVDGLVMERDVYYPHAEDVGEDTAPAGSGSGSGSGVAP